MVGNSKARPPCSLYYVDDFLMVEARWHSLSEPASLMPSGVVRICTDVDTEREVGLVRPLRRKVSLSAHCILALWSYCYYPWPYTFFKPSVLSDLYTSLLYC